MGVIVNRHEGIVNKQTRKSARVKQVERASACERRLNRLTLTADRFWVKEKHPEIDRSCLADGTVSSVAANAILQKICSPWEPVSECQRGRF
jgi:hypothetical protein